MDRKTILAVAICFGVFLLWQKLAMPPVPVEGASAVRLERKPAQVLKKAGPKAPLQVESFQLKNSEVFLSSGTDLIHDWKLSGYRLGVEQGSERVDLRSVTNQKGSVQFNFDLEDFAYLNEIRGKLKKQKDGTYLWTYEDENVLLKRVIRHTPHQSYLDVTYESQFKNKDIVPKYAFVSLVSGGFVDDPEAFDRQLAYFSNNDVERLTLSDGIELGSLAGSLKWVGATNRYFTMAVVSESQIQPGGVVQPLGQTGGRISLIYPVQGNQVSVPVRVYFGPKSLEELRLVDKTLDVVVDFGWFTIIAYPILRLMKWFYTFLHNWGLAIILLTILLKIVTYPLTYKSMKSMKEMAKLQPELQRLREKHKDNKEALNREMLTLMRTNGYNPASGCLPILVQMPVFFALYKVLYSSVELYQAPFYFWIQDLSARDPYYITPVLLTLTMFLQQKLTPNTATDPMQRRMIQMMPVIFGAFMLTLPSGLTVYMLTNAVASIIQQLMLNKKLDISHGSPLVAKAR